MAHWLLVLVALVAALAAPVRAQQSHPDQDASLACFFVLLEASFHQARRCGRAFTGEEGLRYEGIRGRMEGYILDKGGPAAPQALGTLRRQLETTPPRCDDNSGKLSQQFLDEVLGDAGFPARLEEILGRVPAPFDGGCL